MSDYREGEKISGIPAEQPGKNDTGWTLVGKAGSENAQKISNRPEKIWREKNLKGIIEKGESSNAFELLQEDEMVESIFLDLVEQNTVAGQDIGMGSKFFYGKNCQELGTGEDRSSESEYESSDSDSDKNDLGEEVCVSGKLNRLGGW